VSIVVDIQTVSIAIASAGVFLAAIYHILDRSMLKAMALYHGRTTVIKADYEEFMRLYRYMNFDFEKLGEDDTA
jgi:hypothetical protein